MIRKFIFGFRFISYGLLYIVTSSLSLVAQINFSEDFEEDLSAWEIVGPGAIKIINTNHRANKKVLELRPNGVVYALINDSDDWGPIRIEGEILFPDDKDNYLGLIYNYTDDGTRTDFACLYIKGNGSYIRANPWRDGNASRLLYEEYKTPLKGSEQIQINKWHKIKAEIIGNICHFYVGDMSIPKVTFSLFEHASGLIGFKPRIAGWPVWMDNIKVTSIEHFSYNGPNIPNILYQPDSIITDWEVIGPLSKPIPEIEWSNESARSDILVDGVKYSWRPFQVDPRGAVITGRITQYRGEKPVAYFRTIIESDADKTVDIHFSTVDELALWVNGIFEGFIYRDGYISLPENDWNAWYDFWTNPDHEGYTTTVDLKPGQNQIVIRVRNGQFASGGFFAKIEAH